MSLMQGAKKVGEISIQSEAEKRTGTKQMLDQVSTVLKDAGASEVQYDVEKCYEHKKSVGAFQTKANEVMHTGNTGFGAELLPGTVQLPDFLDLAPKFSTFIGQLKGFQGRNLDKISKRSMIGELPLHKLGTEWTTGSPLTQITQGKGKLPTAEVILTQQKLLFSVDMSDEEVRFVTVLDLVAKMQEKLGVSFAQTMESLILNGDTVATANTNINAIDGTPAVDDHFLAANGLRKSALAGGSTSFDAGTLAFDDFVNALKLLGEHGANREDLLWIFNRQTELKALTLPEFYQQYINGSMSTVLTGKLPAFLGTDVVISRYLGLGTATGKQSVTPANNTKGAFMAIKKDAVQYGYNGDYSIEMFRVPGFGWQLFGYAYAAVSVVNDATTGVSPRVVAGYNVTV